METGIGGKMRITVKDRKNLKNVFKNFRRIKSSEEIFYDLCFCICSPQTTFKSNRKAIEKLTNWDFYEGCNITKTNTWTLKDIENAIKPVRFYKNKAKYLIEAKKEFPQILKIVKGDCWIETYPKDKKLTEMDIRFLIRNWLVKNVKGLGMKTASHFLRNLGDTELAIIDTHIIKYMLEDSIGKDYTKEEFNITVKQMTNKKQYENLEQWFRNRAKRYKLTPAELDALIWQRYSKTLWEEFKW